MPPAFMNRRVLAVGLLAALTTRGTARAGTLPAPDPRDEALLPGVVMPPLMAGRVRAMARLHSGLTGRQLVITGGLVGPEPIARRIVAGRRDGEDLHSVFPGRRRALEEILAAMRRAGPEADAQTRVAALAIAAQAARGVFVSPHLAGRAVDVRTIDLTQAERESVLHAAAAAGLRAHAKDLPPHIHIELPEGDVGR